MKTKKAKRLVDVLDEQFNGATGEFLKVVTDKFVKLYYLVKRNSKITKFSKSHHDDIEWCTKMMNKIAEGTIPTKKELETANILWKQYK